MELTAKRVNEVFNNCLAKSKDQENILIVKGIVFDAGFDPVVLEQYKQEIVGMLGELSDDFKEGMSFLAACYDKHGNHWAEHQTMGMLFMLGEAIGKVTLLLPRENWSILPGGMPYYLIKD